MFTDAELKTCLDATTPLRNLQFSVSCPVIFSTFYSCSSLIKSPMKTVNYLMILPS